jgi:hypothetical protein
MIGAGRLSSLFWRPTFLIETLRQKRGSANT